MKQQTILHPDNTFLTVEEAALLIKSTPQSLYLYLCNSGAQGGTRRKRFPKDLYVRIGRKVLFIKSKLVDWIMRGAEFEGGQ